MRECSFLKSFSNQLYTTPELESGLLSESGIEDKYYAAFIELLNGGYFFGNSLHLYGHTSNLNYEYHNLQSINKKIQKEYGHISKGKLFFAADIFGNQFCYFEGKIGFFQLETGEVEMIAENFENWIDVIKNDLDYFTGASLLEKWEDVMLKVKFDERLTPKKPFIIGGDYGPNNLRVDNFFNIIDFNASIAKQIYGLPDGANIEIKLID